MLVDIYHCQVGIDRGETSEKGAPENQYAYNLTKLNIVSTLASAHGKKLLK